MDKNRMRICLLHSATGAREISILRNGMVIATKIANKSISKKIEKAIDTFDDQGNRKELRKKIWADVVAYLIDPEEYFLYGFKDLTDEQKHLFVGNREKELVVGLLNHLESNHNSWKFFMDKWQTYNRFSKYYHREAIHITALSDRKNFIEFIEKQGKAIVKTSDSSQGRGVFVVDRRDNLNSVFDSIKKVIVSGKSAIVEELITQSPLMSQFNNSSVNTVRIATFLSGGEPIVLFTFMRTGRKGAVVDNGGAGGLIIGIDPVTGKCVTEGCDEAGHRYVAHPDSGMVYLGFQIPEWGKALELAKKLALIVPEQKYVGWDLAFTEDGWVMIEGNSWSQFVGPQISQRKGIREIVDHTFYQYLKSEGVLL